MRQTNPCRARPMLLQASVVLLVVLLGSPAFAKPPSPFGPAESLTFDCRFLGLSVGKAQLLVGSPTKMNGRSVWPVMALARTDPLFVMYPIQDKFVTWWDPETRLTLGSEFLVNERDTRKRERVRYARESSRALTTRERSDSPFEKTEYDVPGEAHDVLSAVLALRGHKLEIGDQVDLPVFTGSKNFTLKVEVEKKQPLKVEAGSFDTKVLLAHADFSGGLASKRAIRIYVTDDARHLPIRVDAEFFVGSFVAELTGYEKGLAY